MRLGKSEAIDLLRKWSSDRILLRCEFGFAVFRMVMHGRITLSTDCGEVCLTADDSLSDAVVSLRDIWDFDYVDNRELSEKAAAYDSVLVLTPKTGERGTQARIGFLEIRSDTSEV